MKGSVFPLTMLLALLACPGCSPNHEANVRERARQFVVLLLREDYEACAELTDPAFIRQHGVQGAALRFRIIGAFAKIGEITEEKVRIDTIAVDSEANTATVNLSVQIGDEWKPVTSQRWVRVDGNWYFAL
jgi:hypothetical protein